MIKAVIFDMYETLVTHYDSPLYFGVQIAQDLGIPENIFQELWGHTDHDRTIGKITLEDALEDIMRKSECYSEELLDFVVQKRIDAKNECFEHLNREIIPMLRILKEKQIKIGLISNCFSEEVSVIKNSILFPYFDVSCLSFEQGISKPDKEIYYRCMEKLHVNAEECLYVGDGGSQELETAEMLGMKAIQAVWYFKEDDLCNAKACASKKEVAECRECEEFPCIKATSADYRSMIHTEVHYADEITWGILPYVPMQYEDQ